MQSGRGMSTGYDYITVLYCCRELWDTVLNCTVQYVVVMNRYCTVENCTVLIYRITALYFTALGFIEVCSVINGMHRGVVVSVCCKMK